MSQCCKCHLHSRCGNGNSCVATQFCCNSPCYYKGCRQKAHIRNVICKSTLLAGGPADTS
jgi:hypothetical protein